MRSLWSRVLKAGLFAAASLKGFLAISALAAAAFGLIEGLPWSNVIILALLAAALAAWVFYGVVGALDYLNRAFPTLLPAFTHDHKKYEETNSEHDSLHDDRVRYWEILRNSWNKPGLEALIDAANLPPLDLERPDFVRWQTSLDAGALDLWKLVTWTLDGDNDTENLNRGEFKKLQGRLSNYWQKIGIMVLRDRSLLRSAIYDRHIPHQLRLMKLLVFAECKIEIDVHSARVRKPFLFEIYLDALTHEAARRRGPN